MPPPVPPMREGGADDAAADLGSAISAWPMRARRSACAGRSRRRHFFSKARGRLGPPDRCPASIRAISRDTSACRPSWPPRRWRGDFGVSRPIFVIASRNSWRSSALSIASAVAPIISHAELLEHAHALEREGAVQRGLAAHGRQDRVGALLLDDLGDDLGRDRLDIGRVRHVRVGHDGGGVRVDQDDPVALLAQGLAGLGAGIIELAGLADDDRTRTDDQDRGDVGALGHRTPCCLCARALDLARRRGAGGFEASASGVDCR